MQSNDLDNKPTPRYIVAAEVVVIGTETIDTKRQLFRTTHTTKTVYSVDAAAMAELWSFANRNSVRMELAFMGEMAVMASELWESVDSWTNPFNDYVLYENIDALVREIPYRPDVLGYVDIPSRSAYYGGKGLTLASLR